MASYPEVDLTAYDTMPKKKRPKKARVERAPKTHTVVAIVGAGQRRFGGPPPPPPAPPAPAPVVTLPYEGRRPRGEDMRKQSLYFPAEMLREVLCEAVRLDRSLSWVVQTAWRLAGPALRRIPAQEVKP